MISIKTQNKTEQHGHCHITLKLFLSVQTICNKNSLSVGERGSSIISTVDCGSNSLNLVNKKVDKEKESIFCLHQLWLNNQYTDCEANIEKIVLYGRM